MRILRHHVLKEFFSLFALCLVILLFLFLVGRGLVQMADLVFNKEVNVFLILKLFALSMPFILIFAIPMSILVSSLLTFGRLSADNEIMAIRASGVSLMKILSPLIVGIAIVCLAAFLLSDKLAAKGHYAYRLLLARIGIENPAVALEEGTFIKKFKNFVIFVYEIDKNKLKGVRIYQPQEGRPTRTIIADKGELIAVPEKNIIKLKLWNGTSDEPDPKDPTKLYKLNFKTYDLPLNISKIKESALPEKKPKDMTVRELGEEIERLGEAGIKASYPLSAEIHNKIALSLSSFALLLISVPLAIKTRRKEKSTSFGIGLVLMTLYWVLLIGGNTLAQKGLVSPFLALEFCNIAIGGCGALLLLKLEKT